VIRRACSAAVPETLTVTPLNVRGKLAAQLKKASGARLRNSHPKISAFERRNKAGVGATRLSPYVRKDIRSLLKGGYALKKSRFRNYRTLRVGDH